MLAYAAPRPGREAARPSVLVLIVTGHVLAITAVMLAKSDIPGRLIDPPMIFRPIPIPKDPAPVPKSQPRREDPAPSTTTRTDPVVKVDPQRAPDIALDLTPGGATDGQGSEVIPLPPTLPPLPHEIVRRDSRMITSEAMLRPPYPDVKRMLGEEAALRLKLSIDEQGRVIAVEPVGNADRAFLDSARRHLIRAWRFAPATEDGQPVRSTKVITLRFELGEG